MGLMDILVGMQNGPHGQSQPTPPGSKPSGGMSPLMMALLGLLAYKAMKGSGHAAAPGGAPAPMPQADAGGGGIGDILGNIFGGRPGSSSAGGGGLGDILGGMLGGGQGRPGGAPAMPGGGGGGLGDILGGLLGGNAGGMLNGGLGNILKDLERAGQGNTAQSWVGSGANQSISPDELATALGADTLDTLSRQSGMSRAQLAEGLSQHLPELVNQLTPHGRMPTSQEASRW